MTTLQELLAQKHAEEAEAAAAVEAEQAAENGKPAAAMDAMRKTLATNALVDPGKDAPEMKTVLYKNKKEDILDSTWLGAHHPDAKPGPDQTIEDVNAGFEAVNELKSVIADCVRDEALAAVRELKKQMGEEVYISGNTPEQCEAAENELNELRAAVPDMPKEFSKGR